MDRSGTGYHVTGKVAGAGAVFVALVAGCVALCALVIFGFDGGWQAAFTSVVVAVFVILVGIGLFIIMHKRWLFDAVVTHVNVIQVKLEGAQMKDGKILTKVSAARLRPERLQVKAKKKQEGGEQRGHGGA